MGGRGPQSFKKRQKEQQRKEKQQEKLAKRILRRQHVAMPDTESSGVETPDTESTDQPRVPEAVSHGKEGA